MRTGTQYRASLADGRAVYLGGSRVPDPLVEPRLRGAVDWVARGYDEHYDPAPGARSAVMSGPRSVADLRRRMDVLCSSDPTVNTTFSSLMALVGVAPALRAAGLPYAERVMAFYERALDEDTRIAECITDSKGDRRLPPGKQTDPGAYLHVTGRSSRGVVISGAKLHITGAAVAHHLLVMPTKRMRPGEEPYAVCCAVAANAPGVHIVATTHAPDSPDDRDHPLSRHENMPDAMVVFDEVEVPHEQVFLDGEVEHSSSFAHSLGLWERIGGVAKLAEEADLLVGLAQLIAEANGTMGISHIKDKIAEMAVHATMIRAGLEAALAQAPSTELGFVHPSDLYTNATKYTGAAGYHAMVRHLHEIAGGAVVTTPSAADLDNPEIGALVARYMQGADAVPAADRAQLFRTIRDVTADTLGGWRMVTAIQSGGGLFAQRLVTRKHYDMDRATGLAARAAGLS